MPIRCITFDLDDTLWDCAPLIEGAERAFYAWLCERYPEIGEHFSMDELVRDRREFFYRLPHMLHDFTYLRKQWLTDLGKRWGHAGLGPTYCLRSRSGRISHRAGPGYDQALNGCAEQLRVAARF